MHESVDVVLYTRQDCHLCDDAKAAVRAAETLFRLRIRMREVDIDHDPALLERFTNDVPVIYVNGREAFRHRVTPQQIADYIGAHSGETSPAAPPPAHSLAAEKCAPCRGGIPRLEGAGLEALSRELGASWNVVSKHHLEREFKFANFVDALEFANRVGAIAEEAGHHPDLLVAWGKCLVTTWTHKVDGLTRSDFVLAAKIDRI